MAVERDEIPGYEDFYKPLTSREETLPKLHALKARPMADVNNIDLFEALADTFATLQTEDFETGKVYGDGFVAQEWEATDEVYPNEPYGPCIGYWRSPGRAKTEEVFIAVVFPGYSVNFDRDVDGSVKSSREENDQLHKEPHEVTDAEKEAILDACTAGFPS